MNFLADIIQVNLLESKEWRVESRESKRFSTLHSKAGQPKFYNNLEARTK